MHYKTIALGLIEEQPHLHEQLRASRTLLATMERYALDLKAIHEEWMEQLRETRPGSDPSQIASEAMEIACKLLEERLASASPPNDNEALSLDAAMAYLRRPTPTA